MATPNPTAAAADPPAQLLRFPEEVPLDGRALARHFGGLLRRERQCAGLSQDSLGVLAGLHRTEIGLLERGQRIARIDTLVKVAGGLELPPGALLVGIGWRPGAVRTTGRFVTGRRD
jgi:DNA-binding XRE family transcriptional regulator